MPPVSSVLSTRENCATWYLIQISPNSGMRILTRSIFSRADSLRDHQQNRTPSADQRRRTDQHDIAARGGADGDQDTASWSGSCADMLV